MSEILDIAEFNGIVTDHDLQIITDLSAFVGCLTHDTERIAYGDYTVPVDARTLHEVQTIIVKILERRAFINAMLAMYTFESEILINSFKQTMSIKTDIISSCSKGQCLCDLIISQTTLSDNNVICASLAPGVVIGISQSDLKLPFSFRANNPYRVINDLISSSDKTYDFLKHEARKRINMVRKHFEEYHRISSEIVESSKNPDDCRRNLDEHLDCEYRTNESIQEMIKPCSFMLSFTDYKQLTSQEMRALMDFVMPDLESVSSFNAQRLFSPKCNLTYSRLLEWVDYMNFMERFAED